MQATFYLKKKVIIKKSLLILLAIFFLHIQSHHVFASQNTPTVKLKSTVELVLTMLADEATNNDPALRRQKIMNLVGQRFNFVLMSRLALGNTWKGLSVNEQDSFVELFSALLKNTYVKRIEGYSDDKIIFTKETVKKNLAKVYSLFRKNNDEYSIVYKLRDENGEWLVYDVIIEGASIVKQYRRQFSRIITHENFEGLMVRLDEKVKMLTKI